MLPVNINESMLCQAGKPRGPGKVITRLLWTFAATCCLGNNSQSTGREAVPVLEILNYELVLARLVVVVALRCRGHFKASLALDHGAELVP